MTQQELWQRDEGIAPAPTRPRDAALGRDLPRAVRIGTSSWSFPGWAGIVYDRRATATQLAREGLRAYARHPLLRCVGLDRTYYAPLAVSEFEAYVDQVPSDFRFVVKAPEICTVARFPNHARYGARAGAENPRFLDAAWAREAFVDPLVQGLGDRTGAIVFQFPPQPPEAAGGPRRFAERIRTFLHGLPPGPLYATEIRTPGWMTPAYADALQDAAACHCVTVHPRMAGVAQQMARAGVEKGPALVVRWMLGGRQPYEAARARYDPFDRIVDSDEPTRLEIARAAVRFARASRPVFVTINNKAEGSAPLSAVELARCIVDEMGGSA